MAKEVKSVKNKEKVAQKKNKANGKTLKTKKEINKKTFGKLMPKALSQALELMGEQIMLARKRRHLSMQDIADRATVTRLTISKVEHGDPTVSIGIYARVLYALNLEKDITLLAADDALGRQLQDAELLKK